MYDGPCGAPAGAQAGGAPAGAPRAPPAACRATSPGCPCHGRPAARNLRRLPASPRGPAPRNAARSGRRPCSGEFPDDADASVLEAIQYVDGPKRAGAFETFLHPARDDAFQLVVRDRLRHGQRPNVLAQVECRLVDPRRAPSAPSIHVQLAPQPRHALDPLGDASPERLRIGSWSASLGVEDRDLESVTRDRAGLEPKDFN